jgi:hypothetical protein
VVATEEPTMRRSITLSIALVLLGAPLAIAQAQVGEIPSESLLLIMDSSGSMNSVDENGVPLIDGAKEALRILVDAIPDDAYVGLRVYGHRYPNDDPVNGCRDTELVIPVEPIDQNAMKAAIDSYEARGFTPIGLSLREAANDLPPAGRRTIILVSDGVDTCGPPDPCEVARELAEQGLYLRIHTLGLYLDDPAAEEQLRCIAESTGGTFTTANSIVELLGGLTEMTTGVFESPGSEPPIIFGALHLDAAPVLTLDEFPDPNWDADTTSLLGTLAVGETRWYAIDVPDGSTSQLQATVHLNSWPAEPGPEDYFEVVILDGDGNEIGVPHEVLGAWVGAPRRTYLDDFETYRGAPPSAVAVTDPHAAPPGWPASEDQEPYFVWWTDHMRSAGINGGLYNLWKAEVANPALEPGRYYVGVTWSADVPAVSEINLNVLLYPESEESPVRHRGEPMVVVTDMVGTPVPIELETWTGDEISGERPIRSADVWSVLDPDGPMEYLIDLQAMEVLEIGVRPGSAQGPGGGPLEIHLMSPDGMRLREITEQEEFGYHLGGGGEMVLAWRAGDTGTHTLTLELTPEWDNAEQAAVVAAFVFASDPTPPAAGTIPGPIGDEANGGRGSDLPLILLVVGLAVGLGGGIWWWSRRSGVH